MSIAVWLFYKMTSMCSSLQSTATTGTYRNYNTSIMGIAVMASRRHQCRYFMPCHDEKYYIRRNIIIFDKFIF